MGAKSNDGGIGERGERHDWPKVVDGYVYIEDARDERGYPLMSGVFSNLPWQSYTTFPFQLVLMIEVLKFHAGSYTPPVTASISQCLLMSILGCLILARYCDTIKAAPINYIILSVVTVIESSLLGLIHTQYRNISIRLSGDYAEYPARTALNVTVIISVIVCAIAPSSRAVLTAMRRRVVPCARHFRATCPHASIRITILVISASSLGGVCEYHNGGLLRCAGGILYSTALSVVAMAVVHTMVHGSNCSDVCHQSGCTMDTPVHPMHTEYPGCDASHIDECVTAAFDMAEIIPCPVISILQIAFQMMVYAVSADNRGT